MVSKAFLLWRKSICHHEIVNTQQAANKICHDSSVCVCMFATSVCAYLRVGGEQLGVCTIDFDVCVEREWCVLYCW